MTLLPLVDFGSSMERHNMNYLLADSIENLYNTYKDSPSKLAQDMCDASDSSNNISDSEKRSWENSLYHFIKLLSNNGFGELYLIAEYSLVSKNRMDAILIGYNKNPRAMPLAIIVELKQWSSIKENYINDAHNINVDLFNGNYEYRLHPVQQTINYERTLKCHHNFVNSGHILISSIQYLHECDLKNKHMFFEGAYDLYEPLASHMFLRGEESRLINFLDESYQRKQKDSEPLRLFLSGKYIMGHQAFEAIDNILKGKIFAAMKDDQEPIACKIFNLLKEFSEIYTNDHTHKSPKSRCVIVSGSAGTGKTYIGMNAIRSASKLDSFYKRDEIIFTFSRNKTLKEVLEKQVDIKQLNEDMSTWPYLHDIDPTENYKLIVVDEAHRIGNINDTLEKLFNSEHPRFVILLQDDFQRVRIDEQGTLSNIVNFLNDNKIPTDNFRLESQKRSGEQGNYVHNIQSLLFGFERKNHLNDVDFEINTSLCLSQIDELLKSRLHEFTAKWYAPFDWIWLTRDIGANPSRKVLDNMKYDILINEGEYRFRKYWNPSYHQYEWYKGEPRVITAIDNSLVKTIDAIDQVGCVYTAQGLDYDYIGFIWSKSLIWDSKNNKWKVNLKEIKDKVFIKQANKYLKKEQFSAEAYEQVYKIVLNQYYILLTRARKGIYIWFEDEATKRKFESVVLNK